MYHCVVQLNIGFYCLLSQQYNIAFGYSQVSSSVFQCQNASEQNGQYIPSIPDFYFDPLNAGNFFSQEGNLTTTSFSRTYILTIPPLSPERNCSGAVTGVEYCYRSSFTTFGPRTILEIVFLSRDQLRLNVTGILPVEASLNDASCFTSSGMRGTNTICCETMTFSDVEQFQLPVTSFTFGISPARTFRLLTFNETTTQFNVQQSQTFVPPFVGSSFSTTSLWAVSEPVPLVRFLIGMLE